MEVISEIKVLRSYIAQNKLQKKSIGFTPTMGALHEGHLELIRNSQKENDISVCSIFVNPTQFNNPTDLKNYPRETDKDLKKLKSLGCDTVFLPSASDLYEKDDVLNFDFGYLETIMEGKFRPGHFKGVGLIIAKLFNLVTPTRAYFGTKDLQQLALIQKLTKELFFDCEIVPVKTVREDDGLAMSSRNKLLSANERSNAVDLFKALTAAKEKLISGEAVKQAKDFVTDYFKNESKIELEYFEVVRTSDLKNVDQIDPNEEVSLCIAGYLGKVRLIDNISLI